jgi:UDP-N-acetylmuramoyl-L-alanyl-D-glutamate--2,6-diaminopimelate ligase
MRLEQVLEGVPCVELLGDADCEIRDLAYISRDVKQGGMFAALKGLKADGFDFIPDALGGGAVAVLCERNKPAGLDVNWVRAADAREALAHCAANFHRHPSQELTVVGVTGTKGKTTVTYLLESILAAAGFRSGLLGTIEYRGPGLSATASRTTPEAPDLQRMMRTLRDNGAGHCVMEVSSHALSLKRAVGIDFDVAVFTNLSGDHLDYHRTMEEYFTAKSSLFSLGRRTMAVVNVDDPWGKKLIAHLAMGGVTFGFAPRAMVRVEHHNFSWDGIHMTLRFPAGRLKLESPLLGRPNLYNILAAVSAALTLNIPVPAVKAGIAAVSGVKGRFQKIENMRGLHIFVDYAHTDDALRNLLETARELSDGRVLLVFGAGGDRDRSKRPRMGEAAGSLADWSILTSDNPRTEEPAAILAEVEAGILRGGPDRYEIESDRRTAIKKILLAAREGDTVLIAGKGHEDYQILGSDVIHFDDAEVIQELLQEIHEEENPSK